MPKRKANWWPASILSDPDVLSVDDEGRFVLCKICHVHYAVHGGKKPKPVIMNSNFRTRAWDVHKERTNSHRLQKAQEKAQQEKLQALQGQGDAQQTPQQTQAQSQSVSAIQSQSQVQTQAPASQSPAQAPAQPQMQTQQAPATHMQAPTTQTQSSTQPQTVGQVRSEAQARLLQLQQRRREVEETKEARNEHQLQAAPRTSTDARPVGATQENGAAVTVSAASAAATIGSEMASSGKRPANALPNGTPAPRRRVFRAGSPGSSRQIVAESEAARRMNMHPYDRHSFMTSGVAPHAKRMQAPPSNHLVSMDQSDSSARWRHMHDDVSRALNVVPKRRQQQQPPPSSAYTSGELRAAKTLAQTESGTFGGNNSDKVAKKLRSLNAEYHASNMRHEDALNLRQSDVFDRRSSGYKEYWGTLRDVYTSSGIAGNPASFRKPHHRSSASKPTLEQSKETEADSTTPDDSGSSEDASKPTVVVHDASLLNAIERLTDGTAKQMAQLFGKETSGTREALLGLTSVLTDLREQHGHAFERMIALQEKNLKIMEGILECKLRKEAARNASSAGKSLVQPREETSNSQTTEFQPRPHAD